MKKVCLTILLILVMLLSSITVVNADENDNASFSLTTTNTDIKVGDEVSINLVINSISGFTGINTFTAKKVYNSSIFEYVGATGENGWEVKGDSTNIVLKSNSHSSSGTIAVLKFKAIKAVENTTIQLTNIDACGDDGDVYFEDNNVNSPSVAFKVTGSAIVDPEPDTNTIPDTNTVPDTDTNTTTDTNTNKITNTIKTNNDKTTATGNKIPQTGESYITISLVIVGIILAIVFYAKYRMFENKMK